MSQSSEEDTTPTIVVAHRVVIEAARMVTVFPSGVSRMSNGSPRRPHRYRFLVGVLIFSKRLLGVHSMTKFIGATELRV